LLREYVRTRLVHIHDFNLDVPSSTCYISVSSQI
jgi:hypothetical protein